MEINSTINSVLNKIPSPLRWFLVIGLAVAVGILLWYKGSQVWNGIGNALFRRQINTERSKVQKELDSATEQKKQLEQTLIELRLAKQELVTVKAEKDRLETIFNDQSKTAAQKVAAFKAAAADDPVHTPTDNITTKDLCARAKAIGSSAATIAAVCGQ